MAKFRAWKGDGLGEMILSQAMELYTLGIEVETERLKLNELAVKFGCSSPHTLAQSQKMDTLMNSFSKLEQKHIADTERYAGLNGRRVG